MDDVLARDGLVQTTGRHGTIVLDAAEAMVTLEELAAAADTLAVVTQQIGFDDGAAHDALDAALRRR